jgi:hypothetical protein
LRARSGGGTAYRYEKMTSISRTNLPRAVGINGETKAGKKNTTDKTAYSIVVLVNDRR